MLLKMNENRSEKHFVPLGESWKATTFLTIAVCIGSLVGSVQPVASQEAQNSDLEIDEQTDDEPDKNWSIIVGGGAMVETSIYKGASKFEISPIPYVELEWGRFKLSPEGAEVTIWETEQLSTNLFSNVRFAPEFPDTDLFRGLDRDFAVELGAGVAYDWEFLTTEASFQHDVTGAHGGFEARFNVGKEFEIGRTILELGAGATIQDKELGTYLYGIKAAEANATRQAYQPKTSVNPFVEASLIIPITERLSIMGKVEYELLDKTIRNSPLIDATGVASFGLFTAIKF